MFLKTFEQFIAEGVNDPNILKAVFLAGGISLRFPTIKHIYDGKRTT